MNILFHCVTLLGLKIGKENLDKIILDFNGFFSIGNKLKYKGVKFHLDIAK